MTKATKRLRRAAALDNDELLDRLAGITGAYDCVAAAAEHHAGALTHAPMLRFLADELYDCFDALEDERVARAPAKRSKRRARLNGEART